MATVRVTASIMITRPRENVFAHIVDIDHLPEFVGYGPVPGIAKAKWTDDSGGRLGAVREVTNTDGSTHREEVVVYEPPTRIVDRIYDITSPLRLLARDVRDEFLLVQVGDATRIDRSFVVETKNALAYPAVAALAKTALKPALERHLAEIARAMTG